MRVIRNGSGWDIALDMVFNEKQTAVIIAKRIEIGVAALIRNAVDASMSPMKREAATRGPHETERMVSAPCCNASHGLR